MPDAHNNAKMTGDAHPPEVESDLPLQQGSTDANLTGGTPTDRGRSTERGEEGRPGRGIRKAGLLKESEEPAESGPGGDQGEPGR
jgi:hypothetical protein